MVNSSFAPRKVCVTEEDEGMWILEGDRVTWRRRFSTENRGTSWLISPGLKWWVHHRKNMVMSSMIEAWNRWDLVANTVDDIFLILIWPVEFWHHRWPKPYHLLDHFEYCYGGWFNGWFMINDDKWCWITIAVYAILWSSWMTFTSARYGLLWKYDIFFKLGSLNHPTLVMDYHRDTYGFGVHVPEFWVYMMVVIADFSIRYAMNPYELLPTWCMIIASITVLTTTPTTQIGVYQYIMMIHMTSMSRDGVWIAVLITSGSCKCLNRDTGWDQLLL